MKRTTLSAIVAILLAHSGTPATQLQAACVNPQDITGAVESAAAASTPATQEEFIKTVVNALINPATHVLDANTVQAQTTALNGDPAWQKLDPSSPPGTFSGSADRYSKLCYERAAFWSNDGEIVIATFNVGSDHFIALVVPESGSNTNGTGAAMSPWDGYTLPRVAAVQPANTGTGSPNANAHALINEAFTHATPNGVVFYRYKL